MVQASTQSCHFLSEAMNTRVNGAPAPLCHSICSQHLKLKLFCLVTGLCFCLSAHHNLDSPVFHTMTLSSSAEPHTESMWFE
jgi:hypothetical protein